MALNNVGLFIGISFRLKRAGTSIAGAAVLQGDEEVRYRSSMMRRWCSVR